MTEREEVREELDAARDAHAKAHAKAKRALVDHERLLLALRAAERSIRNYQRRHA